jgi:hypothetical protein
VRPIHSKGHPQEEPIGCGIYEAVRGRTSLDLYFFPSLLMYGYGSQGGRKLKKGMMAANRAKRISKGWSAAKTQWEADKCSKHFSYKLKGKSGCKWPVPMTSVKSLTTRFNRLKYGHAPMGVYLKRFGQREDDKCWRCGGMTSQTRSQLFRHCSQCKDQHKGLWKAV